MQLNQIIRRSTSSRGSPTGSPLNKSTQKHSNVLTSSSFTPLTPRYMQRRLFIFYDLAQVCTVNLIVRMLETSVMEITPHILTMESETVLTQYLITNWTLEYKNASNVDAGIQMTIVLKRRILNSILTVYLPTVLVLIIVYALGVFNIVQYQKSVFFAQKLIW